MTRDPDPIPSSDVEAVNAEASSFMKRGIRLMGDVPPAVSDALACFDRALELRVRLPVDTVPVLRYGLAACWLHRADALMRLEASRHDEAIRAFDEGIALLRTLPFDEDPRFPRRLAMAHQNRGLALHARGGLHHAAGVAALADAIAVLEHDGSARIEDRRYLLAAAWTNLARTLAADETGASHARARDAAVRAIGLVADVEAGDADAADVGLTARHALCQTLASRLSQPAADAAAMPDDVHQATDLADDGLALVRRWEQKGVTRFRGMAYDLFRFGARVYARYQPQFLNEFVLENLDPGQSSAEYVGSAQMRSAAREALDLLTRTDRQA